jgi:putative ABC transport system permease protein
VLAFRLAWRQLRSEPARSVTAITGIMFATMLVLMQLDFRGALFDTAKPLPRAWHRALPDQPADDGAVPRRAIPRLHGFQALSLPEVILGIADRVPTWGTTGSALNIRPKGTRRTSSWMAM